MKNLPITVALLAATLMCLSGCVIDNGGGAPEWDGTRWLIIADDGRILARQRLLTTTKGNQS